MTKKELINAILESLPKSETEKQATRLLVESVLESFGDITAAELLGGGEISIISVGKLKTKATAARKGHNPYTGELIDIPASRKVSFTPYKDFRDALKG